MGLLEFLMFVVAPLGGLACATYVYLSGRVPKLNPQIARSQAAFLRRLCSDQPNGLRGIRGVIRALGEHESPAGVKCATFFSAHVRQYTTDTGDRTPEDERYVLRGRSPGFLVENESEICKISLGSDDFIFPEDPNLRPNLLTEDDAEYHFRNGERVVVFGWVEQTPALPDTYREDHRIVLTMTAAPRHQWQELTQSGADVWGLPDPMADKLRNEVGHRSWIRLLPHDDLDLFVQQAHTRVGRLRTRLTTDGLVTSLVAGMLATGFLWGLFIALHSCVDRP
jgi:hypothetical protein